MPQYLGDVSFSNQFVSTLRPSSRRTSTSLPIEKFTNFGGYIDYLYSLPANNTRYASHDAFHKHVLRWMMTDTGITENMTVLDDIKPNKTNARFAVWKRLSKQGGKYGSKFIWYIRSSRRSNSHQSSFGGMKRKPPKKNATAKKQNAKRKPASHPRATTRTTPR